jgi:hypothetical protein
MQDPSTIYFTHARIRKQFSGCAKNVQETLDEIVEGKLCPTALPFITVISYGSGAPYFSINNRRLWVLKECQQRGLLPNNSIRVRVKIEKEPAKYSAETCTLAAKVALK